jgi:hypothetical protein
MKRFLSVVVVAALFAPFGVHASHPSKHEIQQNKTATSAGRDLMEPSTVQNNTVQQNATEVLTAVVSIVAINGGTYGNIDVTQTGGSITQGTGNTGGGQTVTDKTGSGTSRAAPINISGGSSAAMPITTTNQGGINSNQ